MPVTHATRSTFDIWEEPMATPRGRAAVQGGFARVHNPPAYTRWKCLVADIAKRRAQPWDRREGPLSVTLDFALTKARTSRLQHPHADVDNFAKAAMDAITQSAKFWLDDRQVVRLVLEKRFVDPAREATSRIAVSVQEWAPAGAARTEQLMHEALQGVATPADRSELARAMVSAWQAVLAEAEKEQPQ